MDKHSLVFGVENIDPASNKLHSLGAIKIDNSGRVVNFQDKPSNLFYDGKALYNSFWGCFGFQTSIAKDLYRFLIGSLDKKTKNYHKQTFHPAHSFEIIDYIDLGTWENIKQYQSQCI